MEFVVVVFGVLIALWLQERVNRANEANTLAAAEEAIHSELDDNLMILVAHKAVDQCLSDRLNEVDNRVSDGGRAEPITGHPLMNLKPGAPGKGIDPIYVFFDLRVQNTAWTSAMSSGALARMDRKKFNKLAEIYGVYRMIDDALVRDVDAGNSLKVLAYGTDLTPELRAQLISAMNVAARDRQFLSNKTSPAYMAGEMRQIGWNDKAAMDSRIADFTKSMHGFGVYLRPCAKPFANPFATH
jgi:hypothetical protein